MCQQVKPQQSSKPHNTLNPVKTILGTLSFFEKILYEGKSRRKAQSDCRMQWLMLKDFCGGNLEFPKIKKLKECWF